MEIFERYSIPGLPLFEIMQNQPAEPEQSPGFIVQYEGKSISDSLPNAMEARQLVFLEAKKKLAERRVKFEVLLQKLDAALESLGGDDVWVLGRYQASKS